MRVTNTMVNSKVLLNITRNKYQVDNLYTKLSTGKEVIFPSDNPILASRALKFRANVAETVQYQRNVAQGLSWMEVSEGAFSNMKNALSKIRELAVAGSSSAQLTYADAQNIATEINQFVLQMGTEMNATYAGRYVFSGFRTNEPPVFERDNDLTYEIIQGFKSVDIEQTRSYQKLSDVEESLTYDVNLLKMAYRNMEEGTIDFLTYDAESDSYESMGLSFDDSYTSADPEAYVVEDDEIHVLRDTGEIVLGKDVAASLAAEPIYVSYTKTGFSKGEINPAVYFPCTRTEINDEGEEVVSQFTMNNQSLKYEFGVNVQIQVNSLSKDVYTDKMYASLKRFCELVQSIKVSDPDSLRAEGKTEDEIRDQLVRENLEATDVLQNRFSNLIGMMDEYTHIVSREHTDMGTRMSRLELIRNRLIDEKISYTKLLSDNEDVDYMEVIMNLNTAEGVYQAALKAGGKIVQLTLADFVG